MGLEELLESIDIVEYISQYVELEEKGGEYWGISPFTYPPERTPSFSVRRETGRFYDFSAGCGGSLVSFAMRYNNCSYKDAIEKLQQYAGCDGEVTQRHRPSAVAVARRFAPPKGRDPPGKPRCLPEDYMERYEKRPDKLAVWEAEGISRQSLDKFQVRYDSFSDRLVFPIRSPEGDIINISGRALDPAWKDKGLRKYTYFHGFSGGKMATIYGLAENREAILQKREICLFEGAKSVLLADTWGIHNTGAILTSHLSEQQLKLLAILGCTVVFALDKEVYIRDDRNIRRLKKFVDVQYIWDKDNLLGAKDSPADKGVEIFQKLYQERRRLK